jgi:ASPM-SPD-2-Hydin domain-containing protein
MMKGYRCFWCGILGLMLISGAGCGGAGVSSSGPVNPAPGGAQLSVSPPSVSFGNVTVGNGQQKTGTLSASGSTVTVSTASWNGTGFALSGITFPVTIPAGQSVPFTVSFTPQVPGSVNGTVSFLSDATNSPTNQQLTGTGNQSTQHSVALSWNSDPTPVQGYYVYRGQQTGGPYAKVSALQATASYTDAAVLSGQTYYYVVTALGTNSQESGYSNEAIASIP